MTEKVCGDTGAGIFGYSHMLGGYAGGRGPDACIDAVGLEAHGTGIGNF